MVIITDSREQAALEFTPVAGVEYRVACLPVGDYGVDGDTTVIERKSVADLWNSYTGENYERERDKFRRAKELGLKFILAIEATCFDIRRGHSYFKGGEEIISKKDGMAMLRQLFTIMRKYDVTVWFCNGKQEMAFMVQEYFLARERVK